MVAKRTTKPAGRPEGPARARASAAVKKRVAKKKTAAKTAAKTAPTERAGALTRKATVARTQKLVDAAPLVIDDGDDVAREKIASLREAKTKTKTKTKADPAARRGRAGRSAVERLNDPPPAAGAVLIARVSRAIERELTQIEAIVGGHHVAPRQRTEAERRARTLASLARTLREVMTLRANDRKEKSQDDDAVPRDIGELRLALARRLDRLVADAKTAHPATPERE